VPALVGLGVELTNERNKMSLKVKVLGFGLLAMVAMSAFAAMNASATVPGHFVSDVHTTTIIGSENTTHKLEFTTHGLEGGIVCDEASYHGHVTGTTVTSVTIKPTYAKCHTTGGNAGSVVVDVNGCTYTFTVTGGSPATTEHKIDLVCPAGAAIVLTHGNNCTITIPPQNNVGSFTYTTDIVNTKHAITLHANAQFATQYHAGACVLLGTGHTTTLKGSVTLVGQDVATGVPASITAT
jgi:hypothetical protein